MKQGTTYPIILTVPGIDLTNADWVVASIKPRMKPAIEFTGDDIMVGYALGASTVTLRITQEASLALGDGTVMVDLNWMINGIRGGCVPQNLKMTTTLLKREVKA